MTEDTNNDLYPVRLKDPEVPIQEDCASEFVPPGTTDMEGKKKVLVPELITMTKYLFDNYRLPMYSYINRCLKSGELSRIVGFRPLNRVFNHETVSFPHVNYWKIDRDNFYADVEVELKLETRNGPVDWHGYLVFWCAFAEEFSCTIEELTESVDRPEDEFDLMSSYLVPYYNSKRMDEVAEKIWYKYLPEALCDPNRRVASELAKRMGLTIQYQPVYEHKGVDSILFFAEDDLISGTDRMEKGEDGKKEHVKDTTGNTIHIPANTIVVNTNLIHRDHSAYNIFHECIHYDQDMFRKKEFYLDTNIIFRMMGLNRENRKRLIDAFINKCKDVGIELW